MVGKMIFGNRILTGLLIGGGSGWLASPHSHQLEALSSMKEEYAFSVFERLFKGRGLPSNIRNDNGVPLLRRRPCTIYANSRFGGCG
jgi:hypothetical protein